MGRAKCFCAAWAALILFLLLGGRSAPVLGFAEEELGFVDPGGIYYPPTGNFPEGRISTVHDDLTFALAIAAGFSISDSHTLRIWNQLVDSETLPGAPISYTYGNAGFYEPPNPVLACLGKNHTKRLWPASRFDATAASVTSRFGPYSPFFHFAHLSGSDLQALRDWAWGRRDTLVGYEAFAWGRVTDLTLMQGLQNGGCFITRTAIISMPMPAGSLEAFAIYLHSLGDAYSHADCLAALESATPPVPWGTHTVPALGDDSVYPCDYNPANPKNDDAHGREFGSTYGDAQRTIQAAKAIYAELSARSLLREGGYVPLPLSTTLAVSGTQTTLEGAIAHWATDRNYDDPIYRRQYVASLSEAVQALPRTKIGRLYLPVITRRE